MGHLLPSAAALTSLARGSEHGRLWLRHLDSHWGEGLYHHHPLQHRFQGLCQPRVSELPCLAKPSRTCVMPFMSSSRLHRGWGQNFWKISANGMSVKCYLWLTKYIVMKFKSKVSTYLWHTGWYIMWVWSTNWYFLEESTSTKTHAKRGVSISRLIYATQTSVCHLFLNFKLVNCSSSLFSHICLSLHSLQASKCMANLPSSLHRRLRGEVNKSCSQTVPKSAHVYFRTIVLKVCIVCTAKAFAPSFHSYEHWN